jgi:tRNA(Ile)-lysidine synthetase-like protein
VTAPGAGAALLLPLARLRLPLTARSWRKGDRMRPRGLNGSKKLQDIFVDRKVHAALRSAAPVIVEAEEPAPPDALPAAEGGGRILGILGVQGGDATIPLTAGPNDTENINACLLIMALSDTASS